MANVLYPKFKGSLGAGLIDFLESGLEVKAILVDLANYTYNSTHEFVSSVAGSARVATALLENISWDTDLALFDSDNPVFPAVAGASIEAVILYIDTGVEASSPLVGFWDTGITGAPYTPSGNDLEVFVPVGGWFAL